jgi:hypothetical protein
MTIERPVGIRQVDLRTVPAEDFGGDAAVTTVLNLDDPQPPRRRDNRPTAVAAAVIALLVGIVVGGAASRAASTPQLLPTIVVRAQWTPGSAFVPTAAAWYRDGGRADLKVAVAWIADRPLRLVTAVAEVSCAIEVDGATVATDQAQGHRYAVCAWEA